jgi:hypothetical protein
MSEYTPTTEEIRADHVAPHKHARSLELAVGAAFDRWRSRRDAEKWDQGYRACKAYEKACWDQIYSVLDDYVYPEPENPYAEEV